MLVLVLVAQFHRQRPCRPSTNWKLANAAKYALWFWCLVANCFHSSKVLENKNTSLCKPMSCSGNDRSRRCVSIFRARMSFKEAHTWRDSDRTRRSRWNSFWVRECPVPRHMKFFERNVPLISRSRLFEPALIYVHEMRQSDDPDVLVPNYRISWRSNGMKFVILIVVAVSDANHMLENPAHQFVAAPVWFFSRYWASTRR